SIVIMNLCTCTARSVPPQNHVDQAGTACTARAKVVHRPALDASPVAAEGDVEQAGTACTAFAVVEHRSAVDGSRVTAEGDIDQAGTACTVKAYVVHRPAAVVGRVAAEEDISHRRAGLVVVQAAVVIRGVADEAAVGQGQSAHIQNRAAFAPGLL